MPQLGPPPRCSIAPTRSARFTARIGAGPARCSTCSTNRPITSVRFAAQSGRLLRGAHSRVLREHADQEGARTPGRRRSPRDDLRARDRSRERGDVDRARQPAWPSRDEVRQYVEAADRLIEQAIERADLERPGDPLLDQARALWTDPRTRGDASGNARLYLASGALRAEAQTERLHTVPLSLRTRPRVASCVSRRASPHSVPAFAKTCSRGTTSSPVAPCHVNAFSVDRHNVTNGQFMEFVRQAATRRPAWWTADDWAWIAVGACDLTRLFWERDATAGSGAGCSSSCRCRRRGRSTSPGRRPRRSHAGAVSAADRGRSITARRSHTRRTRARFRGETMPSPFRGNFDFTRWDPEPVGASRGRERVRRARSDRQRLGVDVDAVRAVSMVSSRCRRIPEYSADFFDGDHFVMKGASPVTARTLVRRGFRNWFRPRYPYVYATFRCARGVMLLSLGWNWPLRRNDFASDVADYLHATAPASVALFLRRARVGAVRRDLPAAVVSRHPRRDGAARRHARAILEPLPRPLNITELGCRQRREARHPARGRGGERLRRVHLIDISPRALAHERSRAAGHAAVHATSPTKAPTNRAGAAAAHRGHGAWLVLFLGSNIGNFDPPRRETCCAGSARSLTEGDALLLGTDLVKPARAAARLRRSAAGHGGLQPQPAATDQRRARRHIRPRRLRPSSAVEPEEPDRDAPRQHPQQLVRIAAADLEIEFQKDEWIWTESSYKYEPDQVLAEGRDAGFQGGEQWIDENARFALTLFKV